MDCGNYIPGGCDENCRLRTGGRKTAVCALKDATDCVNFIEKEDNPLEGYSKIDLRARRKNARRKNNV